MVGSQERSVPRRLTSYASGGFHAAYDPGAAYSKRRRRANGDGAGYQRFVRRRAPLRRLNLRAAFAFVFSQSQRIIAVHKEL